MKLFLKNFFVATLLIFIFISCEDDPASIGDDLLKDDGVQFIVLNSTEEAFPQKFISNFVDSEDTTFNLGTSQNLLVGKENNLTVSTLMRFSNFIPDSVKDAINDNTITINKAYVEILPKFFLGDTNAFFDFTITEITSNWTSSEFTAEDLPSIGRGSDQIATEKIITDSLISFVLDLDLVDKWLKLGAGDSSFVNEGILLEPVNGTERIIGFKSNSLLNNSDDISALYVDFQIDGEEQDTIRLNSLNDVHVVESSRNLEDADGNIYLQGGIPLRADFFMDLTQIPEHIAINEATIEFFIDTTKDVYSSDPTDTLSMFIYSDSTSRELFSRSRIAVTRSTEGETRYSGNFQAALDLFLNTDQQDNQGFKITLGDDARLVNRVALRSSSFVDINKRPRLIIKYSKLN